MNNFVKPAIRLAFAVIAVFLSLSAGAQSKLIRKAFKLLPASFVYGITDATKDSLLDGKTYYPPENDGQSVVALNSGESIFVRDYMYISLSYETAQRASGLIELRAFEMAEGKLVIVSNTGGVEGVNYQQNDISAFLYDGNNRLASYRRKIIPDWSEKLFLKPGVPDSIKKVISNNANLNFNFSNADVILSLNSLFLLGNQEFRKWLKGDQITYSWTGKSFIAGVVHFSDVNP